MRGLSVDEYVKKTGKEYPLREGYYIGPCPVCGQRVVKSIRMGQTMHMHRRSKKCRDAAAKG
jgi:predicted RNA-binding Zn-ribbon protein involved in translation (DUF1610 family)